MDLINKTFLVTGASGGIGSEVCRRLSKEKARLVLSGRNKILLEKICKDLGSAHIVVSSDLSTEDGRKKLLEKCDELGKIDGVINAAGVQKFALFDQQKSSDIENQITVNLSSLILLSREIIPRLKGSSEAVLVNVGSTFGSIGFPGFATYCASKAGTRCFTEALSRELIDSNIRVCYVAPRATDTKLNSSDVVEMNNALGNKSDTSIYVANEIVKIIKNGKKIRYIGWPEKLFVKINYLAPGLIDKFIARQLPTIKKYLTRG